MEWLEICVKVIPEAAEAVSELLSRYAPGGVALDLGDSRDSVPDEVTVLAYLAMEAGYEDLRQKIEQGLWRLKFIWDVIPEPKFSVVPDQDWTAGWKKSIPVLRLGKRVVIKPTWKDYTPLAEDLVLHMDPGLAFGTGLHPTTQLCVEALEDYTQPGMRILDMGTGTGILAFVAAKLGAAHILAVDTDENAIIATRRNAEVNGVDDQITLVHGSLADVREQFDLVVANILAPIIIAMTQQGLAQTVKPGGTLIVSGILAEEQSDDVTAALEAVGLHVTEKMVREEWVALVAVKQ